MRLATEVYLRRGDWHFSAVLIRLPYDSRLRVEDGGTHGCANAGKTAPPGIYGDVTISGRALSSVPPTSEYEEISFRGSIAPSRRSPDSLYCMIRMLRDDRRGTSRATAADRGSLVRSHVL